MAEEEFKIHVSCSSFSVQDMNRGPWPVSISFGMLVNQLRTLQAGHVPSAHIIRLENHFPRLLLSCECYESLNKSINFNHLVKG